MANMDSPVVVVVDSHKILSASDHSETGQTCDETSRVSPSSVPLTTRPTFQRHNSLPANRVVRRQKHADSNVRVQTSLIPKRSNSINNGSRQNTWETSQSLLAASLNKQTSLTSLTATNNASSNSVLNRSSVFWSASLLYHTGIPTSVSRHLSCQLPGPTTSANMDSRRRMNKASSVDSTSGSFRRKNEVQPPPGKKKSLKSTSSTSTEAATEDATTPSKKRGLANFINRKGSFRKKEKSPEPPGDLLEVSTEQEESTRCFGSGNSTPEPTTPSNSKLRDSFRRIKFRSKQEQPQGSSILKNPNSSSTSDIEAASRVSSSPSISRTTPEGALAPTAAQPQKKSPKKVLRKLFKRTKASSSSNDKLETVLAIAADPVIVPEDELPKHLKAKEKSITRKFPDIVTFESEPKVLLPTERPSASSAAAVIKKNQSKNKTKPPKSNKMADANEEAGIVVETLKQVYKMQDEEGDNYKDQTTVSNPDNDEGLPGEEVCVKETDLDSGEIRGRNSEDVVDRRYKSTENCHHHVPHLDVPMAGVGLLGPQSFIEHSVSELESGIGISPSSSLEDQLGKLGAAVEEEEVEEVGGAKANGNVLERSSSTTTTTTTGTTDESSSAGNDEAKVDREVAGDVDVAEASETESDDEESTASSTESDLSTSLNLSKSLGLTEDETSYTESFKQLKPFQFEHHEPAPEGKRERLYKVLVVGELGTGKTSIIKRYVHQFFSQHYRATIGVDFALKVLRWDPETVVRLQLWDIAGQERFGSMTRVYYKEAVGAFVVFDVTRAATLEAVPKWKADLDAKVVLPDGRPIPTVLLANKCDQPKEGIAANREKMNEFCQQQGFSAWFETSAKDNINIEDSANFLVSQILELDKWSQEPMSSDPDKLDLGANGKVKAGSSSNCAC